MKRILFLLTIIVPALVSHGANTITTGNYQVNPKTEFTVQLNVDNTDNFVAFQMDMPIPEGFSYIDGSSQLNTERISGHSLSVNILSGNTLRLIGYSTSNTSFAGNSGWLVSFRLKSGTTPSTFSLALNNAVLGDAQSNNILSGTTNGSVTVTAPKISLSTNSLDFGRIALESSGTQYVLISNTGNVNLTISDLAFNNTQFSTAESLPTDIAPGENKQIAVVFAPTLKGVYSKQLTITSNDPAQATTSVTLNSVGYAVNEVHSGNILAASSSTQTLEFTINNMESFTGFQFDINLPTPMTYVDGSAKLYRSADQNISVNQIDKQTVRVVAFSADNAAFSGTDGKVLSLDFSLYGSAGWYNIGISNVIIANPAGENIVSDTYGGSLSITCPGIYTNQQLDFGDVSSLASSTLNQQVYNYGQEPLIINKIQFNTDYFRSNQSLPLTISPGDYTEIPVSFADSVKGSVSATMKIYSNDPANNPFTTQLAANVFIPNYLITNSPPCKSGETGNIDIEVQNEQPFVAMQFDLTYPDGITPNVNAVTLSARKQDHVDMATLIGNNTLRIIAYSPSMKSFTGKLGTVLSIPFSVSATMSDGQYYLTFSNAILSDSKSENILYAAKDGVLNVSYTTNIASYVDPAIQIFPNPTSNAFTLSGIMNNSEMRIMDLNGKLILSKTVNNNEAVSVEALPKGIYIVKVINADGITERKLIKE